MSGVVVFLGLFYLPYHRVGDGRVSWAALLDVPPRGWACFAIGRLVFALDLAMGTRRLDRRVTSRAPVCVPTDYETIPDAKLFTTMTCDLYFTILNGALDGGVAIRALVCCPSRWRRCAWVRAVLQHVWPGLVLHRTWKGATLFR